MKRGVSFGTIAMILIACIALTATFCVILTIRKDEGDLTMDAEKLLASVSELMAMSQRHVGEDDTRLEIGVTVTVAPVSNVQAAAPQATNSTANEKENRAVPAPAATNVPDDHHTVTMTFGGVIAFESAVLEGAYRKAEGAYAYDEIFSGISSAVHADLNFAILETLFSSEKITQKDLLAPTASVEALTTAGFDTMVLCTQNALAGGENSVQETIECLSGNGFTTAGLYNADKYQPFEMLPINGLQIAVLSYTESLSAASTKAVPDQNTQNAMIRRFDFEAAKTDIAAARMQGADTVIVFLHWGADEASEPTSAQKATAQLLCDAGADLLLGYNCRNVHPVEMLTSAVDPEHRMLTAWSLGTLLSEDRDTRAVVSGILLHVQLTHNSATGRIVFDKIEYTPTYCWRQEENGVYPYRVVLSNQSVPEGMIQKQREIIARSLVLIQNTMNKGIAQQR